MATPGNKSRWGSFLSSAVAGVEARLDTILAEGAEDGQQSQSVGKPSPSSPASSTPKPSPGPSRSASTVRTSDRLQERLARAVAVKNAAAGKSSEASPARVSSTASPRQSIEIASRPSVESVDRATPSMYSNGSPRASQEIPPASPDIPQTSDVSATEAVVEEQNVEPTDRTGAAEQQPIEVPLPSVETPETAATKCPSEPQPESSTIEAMYEARITQLETAVEEAQQQNQEEIHSYLERIDALQAKLQYLSREATDAARKAMQDAPAGSIEKKLAEKDQQIAGLMEEGKNLGKTEQTHRTILKKLRAKIAEDEKELNELRTSRSKLQAETEGLRRRAGQVQELEKAQDDSLKRISQLQREANALRSEIGTKDVIIVDLKSQVQKANEQVESATARVNEDALAKERQRAKDLEDQVAALEVEKNLVADRAKAQVNELKEKGERAAERARAAELEMRSELQIMESKLEAMRIRAEEASAGAIGDSQAKLLRQIETLQSQYSIASENWQGIETSLLATVSGLEKERNEAQQREAEMRKKAREAAVRAKRHEEELEEAQTKLPTIQEDVKSYQTQLESLKRRAEEAETALAETKAEHEKQKQSWKEDRDERAEQDRRQWLEDVPGSALRSNSRPESPLLSTPQRTWSSDLLGLQALPNKFRKPSGTSSNGDPGSTDRFLGRRPSAQPQGRDSVSASMFSPRSPFPIQSPIESLVTPSMAHADREEMFEGVEMASSPQQVAQDVLSVSTVAAGPSVQLVEKMGAAIRRLESEKVAAREELARMASQRDEARAEIVALMREAESGRASVRRVADLEAEVAELNDRYQTTLEMLGEKSELVDELRADVQDVKAMYRDLVERTVK